MAQEIPVYLFLGFLEAGKTKFIQETMEDPRFDSGESTLLLVFEEGEEEYDPSRFAVKKFAVETVTAEQITPAFLGALIQKHRSECVLVEWNGMLTLDTFFEGMPDGWMIAQVMTVFDATTFLSYNANMRQLVFDKVQYADMVVFNRFKEEYRKEDFHKIVRAISRRPDIIYEYAGGRAEYDEIEDPLPYDMNAPVIQIEDRDFAYFYRDLREDTQKYAGKTVRFRALVAQDKKMKNGMIGVGRFIMTCCAADIAYNGLLCVHNSPLLLKTRDWVFVKGTIRLEKHKLYGGEGPVIYASEVTRAPALPPDEEVATFY